MEKYSVNIVHADVLLGCSRFDVWLQVLSNTRRYERGNRKREEEKESEECSG